jgi:hypothetical protein
MDIDNENGADNNRSVWYSGLHHSYKYKLHFLSWIEMLH